MINHIVIVKIENLYYQKILKRTIHKLAKGEL